MTATSSEGGSRDQAWRAPGLGGLAFLATFGLLSWRLNGAAFWIDESASVASTHRSWSGLFTLFHGPEAPLVPYYLLLKPAAGLGIDLGLPVEAVYRWPSVLAIALAAAFLTAWLTRRFGTTLSLTTLAVFLLTAGMSRYGQEARPYAVTALFAVLATIAWFRLREAGSRRPLFVGFVLYALAVAVLVSAHLLSATLVVAHVVAAAFLGSGWRARLRGVLLTGGSALLGAVLSTPFTVIGAVNAKGPGTRTPATTERMWATLVSAFTWGDPRFGAGWIIVLAVVGVFGLTLARYRTITVVAVCWAFVPLAVLVPAILGRPTLLRVRYLMFVVPGWALLAALGIVVLSTLASSLVARLTPAPSSRWSRLRTRPAAPEPRASRWSRPTTRPSSTTAPEPRASRWSRLTTRSSPTSPARPEPGSPARVAGAVVAVAVVVALGFSQWFTLTQVRSPAGHGEDVRPAAAFIDEHPTLPLMISGRTGGSVLSAYRPQIGARLLGSRLQYSGTTIWPDIFSVSQRREELRDHREVLVLVRNSLDDRCRRAGDETAAAFVYRCMPRPLRTRGYQVVEAEGAGSGYAAAVVRR